MKKNNYEASVLMPCNSLRYLHLALDSILTQNYPMDNIEVVVVSDGIDLERHIEKFIDHNRIKISIIESEGTGIVDALNTGLSVCRGDVIIRMDSDDIMQRDRLQYQINFMKKNMDVVVCGSQILFIDPNGNQAGKGYYPLNNWSIEKAIRHMNPIAHPAACFRRKIINEIGGYRKVEPEDWDLWIRLKEYGLLTNLPHFLLKYRLHDKQSSRKLDLHEEFILKKIQVSNILISEKIDDSDIALVRSNDILLQLCEKQLNVLNRRKSRRQIRFIIRQLNRLDALTFFDKFYLLLNKKKEIFINIIINKLTTYYVYVALLKADKLQLIKSEENG